jgi:hypothetical protein
MLGENPERRYQSAEELRETQSYWTRSKVPVDAAQMQTEVSADGEDFEAIVLDVCVIRPGQLLSQRNASRSGTGGLKD